MLTMIVAVDRNLAIGRDGDLPWHQSTDLQRFKELTMGTVIVMGRATFESIGRPLPGRRNIVLTKNPDWQVEGVEKMSVDEVLSLDSDTAGGIDTDIFIIGGGQIYELFMPHADAIEMTIIETEVIDADTWFPEISDFTESSRLECLAGEGDDHAMLFIQLERST